jgi:hypothetical protein
MALAVWFSECPYPSLTEVAKQFSSAFGKDTIMLFILLCLARTFLPCAATWGAEVETQAAIMAFGTFAFLVYRLGLESTGTPSPGSHLENSGRIRQG